MSRSSSGSGLRAGRVGVGWDEPLPDVDPAPDPGVAPEVLGPWVGQECWVPGAVGEAGVCGADCGDSNWCIGYSATPEFFGGYFFNRGLMLAHQP